MIGRKRSLTLLALACLGVLANAALARTIRDDPHGFRFEVPDSAREFPEGKDRPTILYSFTLESPAGGRLFLGMEALGGVIARSNAIPLDKLPRGSKRVSTSWHGFVLEGAEMPTVVDGANVLVRAIQIPLKPEAVQLFVMGNQGQRDEIISASESVLRSVEGPSNWLSDTQKSASLGRLVGLAVGGAIGILLVLRLRARRQGE